MNRVELTQRGGGQGMRKKSLGTVNIFGRKFHVQEQSEVSSGPCACDGKCCTRECLILLDEDREPHTDLHELLHACAIACGLKYDENEIDLLARSMWAAGVKVPWEKKLKQ